MGQLTIKILLFFMPTGGEPACGVVGSVHSGIHGGVSITLRTFTTPSHAHSILLPTTPCERMGATRRDQDN